MPAPEFTPALAAVLVHEGGYSNHPRDPGGATMKGVTQRVYDAFRTNHNVAKQSVQQISTAEIQMIYRAQYWDAIKGDDLPAGVAYAVFDGAVNSGPGQAVKWLQRALRMNAVDGHCGQATVAATLAHPDHDRLIAEMLKLRLGFLQHLSTWDAFGKGWAARVKDVQARAQAWASGSVGLPPVGIPGAAEKAKPDDVTPAPATTGGDVIIGAGIGTGGLGGVIKSTQDQLAPLGASVDWVNTVLAVLALASATLVIGGFAWRAIQKWRALRHKEAVG